MLFQVSLRIAVSKILVGFVLGLPVANAFDNSCDGGLTFPRLKSRYVYAVSSKVRAPPL